MKGRVGAGRVASKTLGRKTAKLKDRRNPKEEARHSPVATNQQADVVRLSRELSESVEQQRATADILKVISRSTFDLKAVLDTLLKSAMRLCAAEKGTIRQRDGDLLRMVTSHGFSREAQQYLFEHPGPIDRRTVTGRAAVEGKAIHITDVLADPEYRPVERQAAAGYRTVLAVPMLRDGTTIGVFGLGHSEVNPFTEKQIELVTSFADQAVIAIENARLVHELRQRTTDLAEALEQQIATSEVLQVISGSPGDLQPVFAAMLDKAARICDANFGNIFRWDGDALWLVATHNTPPAFVEHRRRVPFRPNQANPIGQMLQASAAIHVADLAQDERYIHKGDPEVIAAVELGGIRTFVAVPMLKDENRVALRFRASSRASVGNLRAAKDYRGGVRGTG